MTNQGIIVLGMHRNGTSAFAGLLALHGVELGSELIGANSSNESGHWEHREIVALHDELLKELGSSWNDVCRLPEGWWNGEIVQPFRQRLRGILRRDFASAGVWGLKDPRMCRLLPLWMPLFAELDSEILYVLVVRPSAETVRSLESRNSFKPGRSKLLWLQHILESEASTRGKRRMVVTFDQILSEPGATFNRLGKALGVDWPKQADPADLARFIDRRKRHHHVAPQPSSEEWTERAYQAMVAGAGGDEESMVARLAPVRDFYEAADPLYRTEIQNMQDLISENRRIRKKLLAKQDQIKQLEDRLDRIESSAVARIARLLRAWK